MIVAKWPESIRTENGIICNPSPEQCREAGYELYVQPPTPEQIAEQAAAEAARVAVIEALREQYRQTCNGFCQLAGLTVVDKFEDESVITAAIEAANTAENYTLALRLTQLAMALQFAITELRRKDGDDCWDRL